MKTLFLKSLCVLLFLIGCQQQPSPIVHFSEEVSVSDSSLGETELAETDIDQILNIGERIWNIIEKNKAVLNSSSLFANALPKGVNSASELESFSGLQKKGYRFYGKNLYGVTVYDLTYHVVHRFNASFEGRGRYLANVGIVPVDVYALWGYTVNVSVEGTEPVNVGTSENPIASMALIAKMRVSTPLKVEEVQRLYQFRGDSKDPVQEERKMLY